MHGERVERLAVGETCHFTDTPISFVLKRLLKGVGGCSRMAVSPMAMGRQELREIGRALRSEHRLANGRCCQKEAPKWEKQTERRLL